MRFNDLKLEARRSESFLKGLRVRLQCRQFLLQPLQCFAGCGISAPLRNLRDQLIRGAVSQKGDGQPGGVGV